MATNKPAAKPTEKEAKKVMTFQETLGALIYLEDPKMDGKKVIQYDQLDPIEQKEWQGRAVQVINALDKMNKVVVDKGKEVSAQELHDRRTHNVDTLEGLIIEFNKRLKPKKPLVPAYYPSKELAMFILK